MKLMIEIEINKEWIKELEKHPIMRKGLSNILISAIALALSGRGKVIKYKLIEKI